MQVFLLVNIKVIPIETSIEFYNIVSRINLRVLLTENVRV